MNETQRRFLKRLRDSQPAGLPQSAIPKKSCADVIQALSTCGAVEFRKASGGRGTVLCIRSPEAFSHFVTARLPQGLDVDLSEITDRATAVIMLADAKAIRTGVGQGLFVRSTKPGVEIRSAEGEVCISVGQMTDQAGGMGVQLSPERTWLFAGDVVVVENADAFWRHDVVLPEADLAIFGSGNMSGRLVRWLASPGMARCRITHWGDYDPVGVCQYLRLADACPGRVVTYAPPEVDELLPKYGKRKLITRQPRFLDRLRRRTSDPHVRRMVDLFDRHMRGLEQEVLLYDHASVAGGSAHESRHATGTS